MDDRRRKNERRIIARSSVQPASHRSRGGTGAMKEKKGKRQGKRGFRVSGSDMRVLEFSETRKMEKKGRGGADEARGVEDRQG